MDRLAIAANQHNRSMFEVIQNLDKLELKINRGTQTKLENFVNMIRSFAIMNETSDAFQIAETVTKKTGLVQELKKRWYSGRDRKN